MDNDSLQNSPNHETTDWPKGVPFIIGNEACERFSYYGMKAILYMHLVNLFQMTGIATDTAKASATETIHLWQGSVYLFPMIGAILADRYWGKYRTIFWVSLLYCVGHGLLAVADLSGDPHMRLYIVYAGLACIAVGAGGIKPCVSANVGDQFGKNNWFRVRSMFQIFYFSINFGSVFATLLIPQIRGDGTDPLRVSFAFGLPGILMAIATFFFWWGHGKYVHIEPKPGGKLGARDTIAGSFLFSAIGHAIVTQHFLPVWAIIVVSIVLLGIGLYLFQLRQAIEQDDGFLAILLYTLMAHLKPKSTAEKDEPKAEPAGEVEGSEAPSPISKSRFWAPAVRHFGITAAEGPAAVFKIVTIFAFIPVFWAIFDQHSSTWIEQAAHMNRAVPMPWSGELHLGTLTLLAMALTVVTAIVGPSILKVSDLAKVLMRWVGAIVGVVAVAGIIYSDGGVNLPDIWNVLPSQVPALNPAMVMVLIVVMNFVYKGFDKVGLEATPLRRMTIGMFIAGISFVIAALIQAAIDSESLAAAATHCQSMGLDGIKQASMTAFEFPKACEVWASTDLAAAVQGDALVWCQQQGLDVLRQANLTETYASFPAACDTWVGSQFYRNDFYSAFESTVHIGWQVVAYLVLTTAEVMVSITALEFAYTQAPKRMKSTVMGLFLFTVFLGNIAVAWVVANLDLPPSGEDFFWLFAVAAMVTAVLLGIRSRFYVQRDFRQD